jgi:hypothetical protein
MHFDPSKPFTAEEAAQALTQVHDDHPRDRRRRPHEGTTVFRIELRRRGRNDVLTVYSREGAKPMTGGMLERMTRPGGGEAALWTDAVASKASVGGGYKREAVPSEWSHELIVAGGK